MLPYLSLTSKMVSPMFPFAFRSAVATPIIVSAVAAAFRASVLPLAPFEFETGDVSIFVAAVAVPTTIYCVAAYTTGMFTPVIRAVPLV